jgi:hypothetical protein
LSSKWWAQILAYDKKLFMVFTAVMMLTSLAGGQVAAIQSSQTITGTVIIVKPTSSEVNGEGSLDDKTHFEFDVKPSKKGVDGNLEYDDKISKIKLESNQIIFLSVTPPAAVFSGTGILDKQTITFLISVKTNHQLCQNDFFSIIIKDKTGLTIYQKSGYLVSGDIKIVGSEPDKKSTRQCIVDGIGTIGKDIKFDFNIQQNSKLGGSLQYSDKSAKIGLTSTAITSFSESSVNTSTIFGIIQVNEKKNYMFELQVVGNQKPSTKDVFAIVIYDNTGNDVYSKIGIITSGELRVQ